MPNDATRAIAQAMPATRRTALALTGAGLASALTGFAAHAAVPSAPEPVHPWQRATDLAEQLAEVLAEGEDRGHGPGGEWYAQVYPMGRTAYAVSFNSISAQEWSRRNVSLPLTQLFDAHKLAVAEFTAACRKTDRQALGREPSKAAVKRCQRADKAEDNALLAICRYRPTSAMDASAKGKYLRDHMGPTMMRNVLEPRHVAVILSNMFGRG